MAAIDDGILAAGFVPPSHNPPGLTTLPLYLLSEILTHVEDTRDLASLCCACKVLNYMALPQLYQSFTLTSYDRIRFRDHMSEGCGSASPFSMGLNSIVARKLGPLVKSFTLRGSWAENELEEHSRLGRVPESSMMLNIAVRAALNEMTNLVSFTWQLNTKALETVYQGLLQAKDLKALTIRFPSSRHPRPTMVIPPMLNLEFLKITDIDPLCYPDDISTLLAQSRKLKDLRLHWSPRMKQSQEASVRLSEYFRKCSSLNKPLKLKSISFQNFYAPYSEEMETAFDNTYLEEMHVLDSPAIFSDDYHPVSFVETSWSTGTCLHEHSLKCVRHDHLDKKVAWILSSLNSLERLYYISPIRTASDYINRPREPHSSDPPTDYGDEHTDSAFVSLANSKPLRLNVVPPAVLNAHKAMQDTYLESIFNVHGPKLKHLLLPSRWTLPKDIVLRLVRACPNLEQLGFAAEISGLDSLTVIQPFLTKLRALRLLIPTTRHHGTSPTTLGAYSPSDAPMRIPGQDDPLNNLSQQPSENVLAQLTDLNARAIAELADLDDRVHMRFIGLYTNNQVAAQTIKIVSIGWKAYDLGDVYTIPASEVLPRCQQPTVDDENRPQTMVSGDSPVRYTPWIVDSPNEPQALQSGSFFQPAGSGKRKLPGSILPSPRLSKKPRNQDAGHQRYPPELRNAFELKNIATPLDSPSEELLPDNNPDNKNLPQFDMTDPSAYITSSGYPLSEPARTEITRHMARLQSISEAGGTVYKRRIRRVGWDILKHWEIFALDTQGI
ncbi:hypothetical protein KEM54_003185 [Ascosphaera aggregata]|nr:hypothetical protein KEM54_003185 [Ascosphaera aggregata]